MTKICKKCNIEKEINDFYKNKRSKDEYDNVCKICLKRCTEKRKEDSIKYRKKSKEKRKEYQKNYYLKNKNELDVKNKEYYEKNINKIKEYKIKYAIDNKDKIKEFEKERRQKETYKENRRYYEKNRRANDNLYRLSGNMRNILKLNLRKNNYKKKMDSNKIYGCSFEFLKEYIENKFELWMCWDNYGLYNGELNYGWDIDHICPLSNATTEEELIKLFHYTNLQPLCSKINRDIKKNN